MTILSIIILNYNTKDLILKCLKAIRSQYQNQLVSGEFEVIIVDNGSSDSSVESIEKEIKEAENISIIKNKENLGFSKGNNLGEKKAKGRNLLFLNSDTQILDQGFLKMVNFLENHEKVGILGGRLKNLDGSSQKSVGKFYNLFNVFLMLLGAEKLGLLRESPKKEKKVDWVSGACLMIKSNLFKKIGGFDENFFMYVEDMEISFEANLRGFWTFFYPDVNLLHRELGSSNKTFAILNIYKGLSHFYKKYKPFWQYLILYLLLRLKSFVGIIFGILLNNRSLKETYLKAFKAI